jgi:hypothetical protein
MLQSDGTEAALRRPAQGFDTLHALARAVSLTPTS